MGPGEWSEPKVFACDEGFSGVMWIQDLEGGGEHREILLSYKNLNRITENDYFNTEIGDAKLYTNYPNPFNSQTHIPFYIPVHFNGHFTIYDVNGRIVFNQSMSGYTNGQHVLNWMGLDNNSKPLPSGKYWIELNGIKERAIESIIIAR